MSTLTTAATDSSTSETTAAVVTSPASPSATGSLTAPATTANPNLRPGVVAGAASLSGPAPGRSAGPAGDAPWLTYRRTCGSARWVQRHITGRVVRAFRRDAAPSPSWDSWASDIDPVYTARVALAAGPELLEAA